MLYHLPSTKPGEESTLTELEASSWHSASSGHGKYKQTKYWTTVKFNHLVLRPLLSPECALAKHATVCGRLGKPVPSGVLVDAPGASSRGPVISSTVDLPRRTSTANFAESMGVPTFMLTPGEAVPSRLVYNTTVPSLQCHVPTESRMSCLRHAPRKIPE